LKQTCIYGPVNSRRLGPSLGLNILPAGIKVCSFNCAYCQYGWTDDSLLGRMSTLDWPSPEKVERELRRSLGSLPRKPGYLTFSGNGEATLHPLFPEMVDMVTEVRNAAAPEAKTAILSNSTTASTPTIGRALRRLDVRIMKLDCGNEQTFRHYNDPRPIMALDKITAGLEALPDITIQSLFAGGPSGNFSLDNLESWLVRILTILPREVQIYSLDRGTPDQSLARLRAEELGQISKKLKRAGVPATVFG
jgi:wyosine [tRNA(Phe)-imidazoG37] synthetase (radical SAM superfamily)